MRAFSPTAARHLLRSAGFADAPDLYVNSFYDPELDEGCAFEELISFHGGMGGLQTRPFILAPVELRLPDEPIIGAEAVHRLLRGWRRELQDEPTRPRRPRPIRPRPRRAPAYMCCFAIIMLGLGPRFAVIAWWIFGDRVELAFDGWVLPLLGVLFLPWTTLMYLIVWSPIAGATGADWILVRLGVARGHRDVRRAGFGKGRTSYY